MVNGNELASFSLETSHRYTHKDVILYALGLGVGEQENDLPFVYEEKLKVLPSFGSLLGYPGFWIKDYPELGIDCRRVVNGEQSINIYEPITVSGDVVGATKVVGLVDKGPGKDLALYTVRDVFQAKSKKKVCSVSNTILLRGQGGMTPAAHLSPPDTATKTRPDGAPDLSVRFYVPSNLNLIYRLSGDSNPLHIDPDIAHSAGFPRPILHGAATWGIACYVLLTSLCRADPSVVTRFGARFTSPVFPGDTLRFDIWATGTGEAFFQCHIPDRGAMALDNGEFHYRVNSTQ